MLLRMPLVVVIAAWHNGKEGAASTAEPPNTKEGLWGGLDRNQPNKQTKRKHKVERLFARVTLTPLVAPV